PPRPAPRPPHGRPWPQHDPRRRRRSAVECGAVGSEGDVVKSGLVDQWISRLGKVADGVPTNLLITNDVNSRLVDEWISRLGKRSASVPSNRLMTTLLIHWPAGGS